MKKDWIGESMHTPFFHVIHWRRGDLFIEEELWSDVSVNGKIVAYDRRFSPELMRSCKTFEEAEQWLESNLAIN